MMTYPTVLRNPYIIGRPIDEPEKFFGRERLFHFIEDNLRQGVKFILLHGQRRIGKSSVLRNIPHFVGSDEFVFVPFDLEFYSQEPLSSILVALAQDIIEHLELDADKIRLPSVAELEAEPYIFSSQFLPKVYEALGEKNLVLLLDEFDLLGIDYSVPVFEDFFPYLQSILELDNKLFIIPFVGRQSLDMPNLLSLVKGVPCQEIGLLDELSAKRLITKPAEGVLNYETEAIKAILELSAGHPYFTQVIGFAIFGRARDLEKWQVSREDVESIVDKAIESAEAGLAWFWDGLSSTEKVVFSSVAEAQKIAIEKADKVPQDSLNLLKKYGVYPKDSLVKAVKQLVEFGFLDDTGRRVKIELVRRWLVQRHPLRQELEKVKKLEKSESNEANNIYIHTHQGSGIKQEQEIEVSDKGALVWLGKKHHSLPQPRQKRILLSSVAVIGLISAAVGFGVYQLATPCLPSENKKLGIFCIANPIINISRGELTLFPITGNTNRDLGIEAFKKGNYSEAAQFFKQAVADNRNDPEVLIYYNNALARKQGSRLTIAAVVPADNKANLAKEMLRGIAQSQNQFNQKGGLNGKLLEVIIANDANEQEQAKQIAQELVKDKSIMGVIGHNSGEATNAALAEYKLANLAIISPTSTSISLQGDNFFRTVPSDHPAGKKLAEYASQTLKLKKVVIFANPESTYSDSMREVFTKYFEKLGGEVVHPPLINLADPKLDVDKEVPKSVWRYQAEGAALFPDTQHTDVALKVIKYNGDLIARPQNTQKKGLKLLGGNSLYNNDTLILGGKAAEGLILAVPWFKNSPQSKNFSQAAAQQWGGEVSWRTATSYDATQALIKALSINPTRATVLQQLKEVNLSPQETSGESLSFGSGERKTQPILVKIEGGEFKLVE
ncbi:ABC transporter substrate-binding protein [Limnofasciculus baicalensis]|uniref:ABC transporter substrate-binding protein n=1 Tax=Limnofasciculus baicalensis BBK-W-15 TaxID=2699891 RepID=A0AAE3GV38_9CYAN|nr:ABC transporter substrate-binding protein [Limnofasciculus baicalensis]MCP2730521.1 ABC transporter substrate-binding protein [Limnofasciculus baicalensis BBK-W-15]